MTKNAQEILDWRQSWKVFTLNVANTPVREWRRQAEPIRSRC